MHSIQVRYHIIERIAARRIGAFVTAKEAFGEIVQRFAVIRRFADQGVGIQPDEQGLAVIVTRAPHP